MIIFVQPSQIIYIITKHKRYRTCLEEDFGKIKMDTIGVGIALILELLMIDVTVMEAVAIKI